MYKINFLKHSLITNKKSWLFYNLMVFSDIYNCHVICDKIAQSDIVCFYSGNRIIQDISFKFYYKNKLLFGTNLFSNRTLIRRYFGYKFFAAESDRSTTYWPLYKL